MGVTEERIRNLVVGLVVRDGHVLLESTPAGLAGRDVYPDGIVDIIRSLEEDR